MSESKETRSKIMRAVKGKNTTPELIIRKLLSSLGFRYRLHDSTLPGKPDIVFKKSKKAIFIHGCFWHGHDCKRGNRVPASNQDYWIEKIQKNKARDQNHIEGLKGIGWSALIIWECDLKDLTKVKNQMIAFLELH